MKKVTDFQNIHQTWPIVVCGCGKSLNNINNQERFITIGVNDVGRKFQPNYLVVVNPRSQFTGDRFRYVETSNAEYLFTQLDLGVKHPNIVKFKLGQFGGTDFSDKNVLHYTNNSPYIALCLAIHMGAKRIGVLGVDFTEHHFFAKTGRHPLAPRFEEINEQYHKLARAAKALDIEIFNLSSTSRLTAFPKMSLGEFADNKILPARTPGRATPRVFGVNYQYLACGDVFSTGLRNAAEQLGVTYEDTLWDDPALPAKIERFQPDLIFVVHGRRFAQKWGGRFSGYQTAVWLTDEPYEVDDTARWSGTFQTVFMNDPNTIQRHRNAHYLPVCFDAAAHLDKGLPRIYKAGFIGGFNETRERYLNEMAGSGLLSYVVGGPWKSKELGRLSLGKNVPPKRTTELYQQTQVVVNVFRDIHHFNNSKVAAHSMNPRIYEALACGALVLSEGRPEISEMFPELPTFDDQSSMIRMLERLVSDEMYRSDLLKKNRARLAGQSYNDRLAHVLKVCLNIDVEPAMETRGMDLNTRSAVKATVKKTLETPLPEWLDYGKTARVSDDGEITLSKPHSKASGSETGLVSLRSYNDVEFSFDLRLDADTWFVAKIHQLDQFDQTTNSYHVVCEPRSSYVAKHNVILSRLSLLRGAWQNVTLRWVDQLIEVFVDNKPAARIPDNQIQSGFCFLGVKGGRAQLKNVRLTDLSGVQTAPSSAVNVNGNSEKSRGRGSRRARIEKPPQPGSEIFPFTATPRRNLIYHIYPVRGSMWKWNLDQLKSRLELFNGNRVLGVVYDDRSVSPECVREYLDGDGFEFVIEKNDNRGEAITFPLIMQKIASDDPNEVTFYAHAKGVKYEPNVPAPVRRWSEVQYRVTLDDWLTVRDQLQRFAMTGPFKMLGRFRSHQHLADWHYSGTYFWMRNAYVFSRNYKDVPQFYGGVETFPGIMFRKDETACLFMDNLRQLPYHPKFWSGLANDVFRKWEARIPKFPPPRDLAEPSPYKGHTEPRMEKKREEFEWWVKLLLKSKVSRVLTIGSNKGAVEWHLAREFFERKRKIEITTIEKNSDPRVGEVFRDAERQFHQSLKHIRADTNSSSVKEELSDRYDAVFIDGDHSYRECRNNFALARSLKPKLIGLHDIVDSDWHACARCCVSRVWSELSRQYRTTRKASGDWGGIGVVMLNGK